MTPAGFIKLAERLHGKNWKSALANDLVINVSTIHNLLKRAQIPGVYEIAVKALLLQKIEQDKLEKAARRLLPRKYRKRSEASTAKRTLQLERRKPRLIPYAGQEDE